MPMAIDVAAYIMSKMGEMTAMKLQKLLYYSHAWSLVWDDKQLFPDSIEAWANGPVIPSVYAVHRGQFKVNAETFRDGDIAQINDEQRETIDAVIRDYGDKTPNWLSELTHQESPWKDARKGIPAGERSSQTITDAAMAEYYGSL